MLFSKPATGRTHRQIPVWQAGIKASARVKTPRVSLAVLSVMGEKEEDVFLNYLPRTACFYPVINLYLY